MARLASMPSLEADDFPIQPFLWRANSIGLRAAFSALGSLFSASLDAVSDLCLPPCRSLSRAHIKEARWAVSITPPHRTCKLASLSRSAANHGRFTVSYGQFAGSLRVGTTISPHYPRPAPHIVELGCTLQFCGTGVRILWYHRTPVR